MKTHDQVRQEINDILASNHKGRADDYAIALMESAYAEGFEIVAAELLAARKLVVALYEDLANTEHACLGGSSQLLADTRRQIGRWKHAIPSDRE